MSQKGPKHLDNRGWLAALRVAIVRNYHDGQLNITGTARDSGLSPRTVKTLWTRGSEKWRLPPLKTLLVDGCWPDEPAPTPPPPLPSLMIPKPTSSTTEPSPQTKTLIPAPSMSFVEVNKAIDDVVAVMHEGLAAALLKEAEMVAGIRESSIRMTQYAIAMSDHYLPVLEAHRKDLQIRAERGDISPAQTAVAMADISKIALAGEQLARHAIEMQRLLIGQPSAIIEQRHKSARAHESHSTSDAVAKAMEILKTVDKEKSTPFVDAEIVSTPATAEPSDEGTD